MPIRKNESYVDWYATRQRVLRDILLSNYDSYFFLLTLDCKFHDWYWDMVLVIAFATSYVTGGYMQVWIWANYYNCCICYCLLSYQLHFRKYSGSRLINRANFPHIYLLLCLPFIDNFAFERKSPIRVVTISPPSDIAL